MEHNGRKVSWIPDGDKRMQKRLFVRAHTQEADHPGVDAILARLRGFCACVSGNGGGRKTSSPSVLALRGQLEPGLVPRPLGETVYGTAVGEVVHFNFHYLGDTEEDQ